MIKLMLLVFNTNPTFWTLYVLVGFGIAFTELVASFARFSKDYPTLWEWVKWIVVSIPWAIVTTSCWVGVLVGNIIYFKK